MKKKAGNLKKTTKKESFQPLKIKLEGFQEQAVEHIVKFYRKKRSSNYLGPTPKGFLFS